MSILVGPKDNFSGAVWILAVVLISTVASGRWLLGFEWRNRLKRFPVYVGYYFHRTEAMVLMRLGSGDPSTRKTGFHLDPV